MFAVTSHNNKLSVDQLVGRSVGKPGTVHGSSFVGRLVTSPG